MSLVSGCNKISGTNKHLKRDFCLRDSKICFLMQVFYINSNCLLLLKSQIANRANKMSIHDL